MAASLSLSHHSLTGSHSTCTLYHLSRVFNHPPLCIISPPLFSFLLKYVHLISLSSLVPSSESGSLPLLFSPLLLCLSSLVVSLRGAALLLTVCYKGAKRGGGENLWETGGPCLSTQVLVHCETFERRLPHIVLGGLMSG